MREIACPKCGSEHWHPTGKVDPAALAVARAGGPKAPVIMSIRGGHCLACNYEEEAVYEDKPEGGKAKK
jgi:hypothetical protein